MNRLVNSRADLINPCLIRLIALNRGIAGRLAQLLCHDSLQTAYRLQIRRHECREQFGHHGESEPLVGGVGGHLVLPKEQLFSAVTNLQTDLPFHRFRKRGQQRVIQIDPEVVQRKLHAVCELIDMYGLRQNKEWICGKFTIESGEIAPEMIFQLQFGNHGKCILLQCKVENRQIYQLCGKIGLHRKKTLHHPLSCCLCWFIISIGYNVFHF